MRLQNSKLCVNCESLYEGVNPCPYCRSEVFVWLFRALGTALEADMERTDDCTFSKKESSASRGEVFLAGSPATSFGDQIMRSGSLAEFRASISRLGREMTRALTLGMIQVFK